MNIVRMLQGSPEWHEHRRRHRNASETPVLLGLSPWQTPYQLWQDTDHDRNGHLQYGLDLLIALRALDPIDFVSQLQRAAVETLDTEGDATFPEDLLPSADAGPDAAFTLRVLLEEIDEALDELESDPVIQRALGPIYPEFLKLKRMEWNDYHRQVSAWEVDRYLTML